jgi:resuscitation-promoting factor RpfB
VPDIDLANHTAWRRSLRCGRIAVGVLLLSLTLAAGGALAQGSGGAAVGSLLRLGSSGATVTALQRALGIEADGIYGRHTRRAVRRFQRRHGLVADGVAGPATLRALGVTSRKSSARSGSVAKRLGRIAQCESGGDPTAVSRSGRYRGKYQFSRATWRAVGGKGDPAKASEAEQDMRAEILYRRSGPSAWPNCA